MGWAGLAFWGALGGAAFIIGADGIEVMRDPAFWVLIAGGCVVLFIVLAAAEWVIKRVVQRHSAVAIVVMFVLLLEAVFLVLQAEMGTDFWSDLFILYLCAGGTWFILDRTDFHMWWWGGLKRSQRSTARVVVETLMGVVMLTAAFSGITAVLEARNHVQIEPDVKTQSIWKLENYYAREFFNSVPELEIPSTIDWKEPFRVTNTGGGLLLIAYKLLVIIPVLAAIAEIWRHGASRQRPVAQMTPPGQSPADPESASG